jgi:nicotinamidase-related amidase
MLMPLTLLDPQTALVIVDLQRGHVSATPDFDAVVDRSHALATAFRAHGLPVVLVVVDGVAPGRTERPHRFEGGVPAGYAEILAELDPQPGDIRVTKRSWGAFATTDLEQRLKTLGVTQIVVTGIATGSGVEATARQAYEAGFNVTLAIDAMTDIRAEAHAYSIASVFPRLGETGATEDILSLLERRG